MVAFSLLNQVYVDVHLAPIFIKRILHREIKFIDVKGYSEVNYNSYNYILNNFNQIISHNYIRVFTQGELELLICGIPEIDIDDMMKNTILHDYTFDSPTVKFFFSAIRKWDKENLARLLQFMTGSSKVPANGFGDHKICIERCGGDALLMARACNRTLILPDYQNEEVLNSKLLQAVLECNTFAFD